MTTNLGQDDRWVYPHMSCDFDLCLTLDLDIGVNVKFSGYIFYATQKIEFYLLIISYCVFHFNSMYMDLLGNTSFQGVTGPVLFHGADRYGPIGIIQHLSGTDPNSIYCTENVSNVSVSQNKTL